MTEAAKKKVLIVEDDPDAAETAAIVLEDKGYSVSRAASAAEGLELVRAERPDVVLLDIMMPEGTEGFHFVWSLRQDEDEALRKVPIVVLTAIHDKTWVKFYPDKEDPQYEQGEFLPVQGFLDKPASSDQLISKIEDVLAEAAAPTGGKDAAG